MVLDAHSPPFRTASYFFIPRGWVWQVLNHYVGFKGNRNITDEQQKSLELMCFETDFSHNANKKERGEPEKKQQTGCLQTSFRTSLLSINNKLNYKKYTGETDK